MTRVRVLALRGQRRSGGNVGLYALAQSLHAVVYGIWLLLDELLRTFNFTSRTADMFRVTFITLT